MIMHEIMKHVRTLSMCQFGIPLEISKFIRTIK